MKSLVTVLALLGFSLCGHPTHAQRIGIAFDPDGQVCSRDVVESDRGSVWVLAFFDDLDGPPIVGAQFRIVGLPAEWSYSDRNDSVNGWGHRDIGGGVTMGFSNAVERSSIVPLWRIDYRVQGPQVPPSLLRVESHPFAPTPAPVLVSKDTGTGCAATAVPRYTTTATAIGLEATINGRCTISVKSSDWEGVKKLYR